MPRPGGGQWGASEGVPGRGAFAQGAFVPGVVVWSVGAGGVGGAVGTPAGTGGSLEGPRPAGWQWSSECPYIKSAVTR